MTAASAVDRPTAAFHCSADWHLIRLGKYAAPIHALMLRVQDEDFIGSVEQIAEYFGADDRAIRRTLHKLIKSEFVLEVASRFGQSTVYRALTHKEWAETHPGECAVKRTAGQGIIKFDANPSPPRGGVGASSGPSHPGPLPTKGSTPLPMKGRQVSEESPKEDDTVVADKAATPDDSPSMSTPVKAAQAALGVFCREMYSDEEAFQMLLWILYGAARAKTVPQNVAYYRKARDNFDAQHEYGGYAILAEAESRFNEHADFLAENSPDLLAWVREKSQEIHPADEILPGPDLSDPLDEIPF